MTAFDLETFLALPRLSGLVLSPGGDRLVLSVARPDAKGHAYVTALWEIDPAGRRRARRLTRSAPGESDAAFLADGSLLFVSTRPDPDATDDESESAALWLLPAGGGEARLLAAPPGGVAGVAVAREASTVVFGANTYPDAQGWEADEERHKAREEAGVTAQLFTGYPLRFWDHYLGPRERRFYTGHAAETGDERLEPAELTPKPGRALDEVDFDITPDGGTVVTGWRRTAGDVRERWPDLVAIDVATGERRILRDDAGWYHGIACAPDNARVACVRIDVGAPDRPADVHLLVVDLATGDARRLAGDLDRWPEAPAWLPDASALLFTADDRGHHPVFRVDTTSGGVTRLTAAGAYADVCVAPDGRRVYALRSDLDRPPHPVAFDPVTPDQHPAALPGPGDDDLAAPGRVERVVAAVRGEDGAVAPPASGDANDGTPVPSWLVLPPGASATDPAPLVVFIHGGPLGSWLGWHWRWNPQVLAQQGYAVLCPDPALSTGYGRDFVARGWGRWGAEPYTDVMAAVEDAAAREDIDADRVAAMGGSFGGYLANWIAGHTDRFRAIVTHASIWALEGFHGTTDMGVWWEREFGDPYADSSRYVEHSPHRHVSRIRTPMLVIHGEQDFRVPVGEALTLWTDLRRHDVDAKFLYFPDENHWVSKPQNARLWYQTVLAFLDHHVRDRPWTPPGLL